MEGNKDAFSAKVITGEIKGTNKDTTFFELVKTYHKHLEDSGQFSRLSAEKPRVNHFQSLP